MFYRAAHAQDTCIVQQAIEATKFLLQPFVQVLVVVTLGFRKVHDEYDGLRTAFTFDCVVNGFEFLLRASHQHYSCTMTCKSPCSLRADARSCASHENDSVS